jgi:hypothetical protein
MQLNVALRKITCLSLLLFLAEEAVAQSVRVSVKHVLDANGNRSIGHYTSDAAVEVAISQANTVLANNGFQWNLELIEIVDVAGASQHFNLEENNELYGGLEASARANASAYQWRFNAINIYIVNNIPGAGGVCSFPMSHEIIAINNTGGILGNGIGWLHEIGHYLSLTHTFEQCGCSPSCVLPCTGAGASHTGSCTDIIGCSDTCPDTRNVMSYNSLQVGTAILSPCQKQNMEFELFDPSGVRSHVLCPTTLTLMPGDDLGTLLPLVCSGGVVTLTAGVYDSAPLTLARRVTLVSSGGVTVIQ